MHSFAVVVVDVVVGVVKYLETDTNTDTHGYAFTSNHKELAPDTNTGTYTYTYSGSSIPRAFKPLILDTSYGSSGLTGCLWLPVQIQIIYK